MQASLFLILLWGCSSVFSQVDEARRDRTDHDNEIDPASDPTEPLFLTDEIIEKESASPHRPLIQVTVQHPSKANHVDGTNDGIQASQPDADDEGLDEQRTWGGASARQESVTAQSKEANGDGDEGGIDEDIKRPWGVDDMEPTEDTEAVASTVHPDAASVPPTMAVRNTTKRAWGTAPAENATSTSTNDKAVPHNIETTKVPFKKSIRKETPTHPPPDGFVIKARVYIDPVDKLAHLSEDIPHIPYWDCGITGSTY